MKTGDKVIVVDGSYSLELNVFGSLQPSSGIRLGAREKQVWTIVVTDPEFKLPTDPQWVGQYYVTANDTIIISEDGRFVFIRAEFLKYANCPTCNRGYE